MNRRPLLRTGVVKGVVERRGKTTILLVETEEGEANAVNYEELTGEAAPGDRVVLNVSAVALGLGTGGQHFVVANLSHPEVDFEGEGRGMKLRYTPLQRPVELVEEEFPELFSAEGGLEGMPVVLAPLHSLAIACMVGLQWLRKGIKVAFIMDDSAGLMAGLSEVLRRVEEGGMARTITVGQAFGGELEAVNIYTGLVAAKRVCGAEVAVVGSGPGHVGTGTRYGFSSLSLVSAANAAKALEGVALLLPRISFADARERHRGLSHHMVTLLSVCLTPLPVVFPSLPEEQEKVLAMGWQGVNKRHRRETRDGGFMGEALEAFRGLESMGRTYDDDPAFFQAAGATSRMVLELVDGWSESGRRGKT